MFCQADLAKQGEENEEGKVVCTNCNSVQEWDEEEHKD